MTSLNIKYPRKTKEGLLFLEDGIGYEYYLTTWDKLFNKYVYSLELSKRTAKHFYHQGRIGVFVPIGIVKYGILWEWWNVIYERKPKRKTS